MKHNINLNNKIGTYSNLISKNIHAINAEYENSKISVDEFRNNIINYTKEANKTEAYKKFIINLKRAKSKADLLFYVTNATLNAEHLSSNMHSRWSNEN